MLSIKDEIIDTSIKRLEDSLKNNNYGFLLHNGYSCVGSISYFEEKLQDKTGLNIKCSSSRLFNPNPHCHINGVLM